jgi:catechol 2,3-dioxygenase-like lactoylglutathione lyase family enzyme
MTIRFNHTLWHARDSRASASWLAELFDLPAPRPFGPFMTVVTANDVSLDFIDAGDCEFQPQHYAFLVNDAEFDRIFASIQARGMEYWADPMRQQSGTINHHFGGRGVYFLDPDGHFLEIITQPYA